MGERSAIHPDISLEKAWRSARRIYIRAGYKSQLNNELRDIGAKWDAGERALWVGSGKLNQVTTAVLAQGERIAAVEAIKTLDLWVEIPYDAAEIRTRAKRLGARWDRERKLWAMPTAEALTEIRNAVATWNADRAAAREAARRERQAAAQQAPEDVIAASGRTVIGEQIEVNGRLHGRMRRPEAEQRKPQVGTVRRVEGGQRVLVISSVVEFWSQDNVDDVAPHREPGWYWRYTGVPVEPDTAEREQDAAEQAERDDEACIAELFAAVRAAVERHEAAVDRIEGPSVTTAIGAMGQHNGRITLADGMIHYYHPGWYDDWRATAGDTSDPELIARFREIIAGGPRNRGQFTVTVSP